MLVLVTKIAYIAFPPFLLPLAWLVTRKSRKQEKRDAKRDAKDGIVCRDNRKDLCIPNSFLFQVGTY